MSSYPVQISAKSLNSVSTGQDKDAANVKRALKVKPRFGEKKDELL